MTDRVRFDAAARRLLQRDPPRLPAREESAYIRRHLAAADRLLALARRHGTPLYAVDEKAVREQARRFLGAFRARLDPFDAVFALKSNNHPAVAAMVVEEGLGLDVSSGAELTAALETGCDHIVFSGPGKTDRELTMALGFQDRVTLLLDSFGELRRVADLAGRRRLRIRAGVRLTTGEGGLWRKFGIPVEDLAAFLAESRQGPVTICGLQFHTSWNMDPGAQCAFIARLGEALAALPGKMSRQIQFLDIGGGFWPERGEWLLPGATPRGRLLAAAGMLDDGRERPARIRAAGIDRFAAAIADAVETHIHPLIRPRIQAEPGRWISDPAMHILLGVVDRKARDLAVTDGGTNMVGWDRYTQDYCPVLNLSDPAAARQECLIAGSLCTPHDIWATGYYGRDINPGDVLCLPDQGAYTWSLRQQFIKGEPKTALLEEV